MNDGLVDLYQEVILDHSRNPRNFGPAEGADLTAQGNNPLCGDRVTIFLKINGDRISEAKFDARGCAISLASASMMTEMIKGKSIDEAMALFRKFLALVTGENGIGAGPDLAQLKTLSGVSNFPTRVKCATLSWHAMVGALNGIDKDVKTE